MDEAEGKLTELIATMKDERGERRRHKRVKSLRRSRVVYGDEQKSMPCFIVNLSRSGARLRVDEIAALPDRFKLELEADLFLECETVYRAGDACGVRFIGGA